VVIFSGGFEGTVAGTSCSSPIFASAIGMLNAELIAAGKRPLGFLNPFIYANPQVFNDITTGSNPGCNTTGFPVRIHVGVMVSTGFLTLSSPGPYWLGSGKSDFFFLPFYPSLVS
jgi:subtilase family serine protease